MTFSARSGLVFQMAEAGVEGSKEIEELQQSRLRCCPCLHKFKIKLLKSILRAFAVVIYLYLIIISTTMSSAQVKQAPFYFTFLAKKI